MIVCRCAPLQQTHGCLFAGEAVRVVRLLDSVHKLHLYSVFECCECVRARW